MTTLSKLHTAMRWLQATAIVQVCGSENLSVEPGFNYDPIIRASLTEDEEILI